MKRFRFELVAIALFSVLIGLAALAPTSAHAESGCLDQDRAIFANTIFNLGYQCEVSGDVEMQIPGGSYQRLYDDDDSATALLVRCTDQYGCSARTNPYGGAYVSARDTVTMVVDTFKYVPNLRYMDAKCFPVGCGVTRYFPQLSWPYYTSTTLSPVAPPAVTYTRMYFNAGTPVIGGWIYINGSYVGYSCYVPSAWGSGYADGGQTNPQFAQGASVTLCSGGSTVPNPVPTFVNPPFPWPFPWPYPVVSPTGGMTADVCTQWGCKTFWWNDMVVGGVIYLNDGSVFRDCYVSNYHLPGTQVGGYALNPSSNYGVPQCDAQHRVR